MTLPYLLLLILLVIFGLALAVGAILGLVMRFKNMLKLRNFEASSEYPDGFSPELRNRFPNYHIYFVPKRLLKIYKISKTDLFYGENQLLDWWDSVLRVYPTPPKNDKERDEREGIFWKRFADLFTVNTSDTPPLLKPKQEILDYFRSYEKWIFREFYAATGLIRQTIAEKNVALLMDLARARAFYDDENMHVQKANDAITAFNRDTMAAHFKKEGEWFYFGIQEAFQLRHGIQADYGPQTPTSPKDHPAQDDLDYTPNI